MSADLVTQTDFQNVDCNPTVQEALEPLVHRFSMSLSLNYSMIEFIG